MHPSDLTTGAAVALGVASVFAVANWWSVSVGRRVLEWVTKPSTMIALIAAATLLVPVQPEVRAWMVAGLVCSFAGDVFLMLPDEQFVAGLASFLVGHVAYVVALALAASRSGGVSMPWALVGLGVVCGAVATLGRTVVRHVHAGDQPELTVPVIAYLTVISAMVAAAFMTGNPWAICGALFFYSSDGVLAWNKFVKPFGAARPVIMSTYHLAQFGLVLSLLT